MLSNRDFNSTLSVENQSINEFTTNVEAAKKALTELYSRLMGEAKKGVSFKLSNHEAQQLTSLSRNFTTLGQSAAGILEIAKISGAGPETYTRIEGIASGLMTVGQELGTLAKSSSIGLSNLSNGLSLLSGGIQIASAVGITHSLTTENQRSIKEFSHKIETAKRAHTELYSSLTEQVKKGLNFKLTNEQSQKIASLSKNFTDLSQSAALISEMAKICGASPKVCKKIDAIGNGLMTVGQGLSALATAGSIGMAGVTGGLTLFLGGLQIAGGFGLFGGSDDEDGLGEALQQLMMAINGLYDAIDVVNKNVISLKQMLFDNMVVMHNRLNQLNHKLDRLETIIVGSFKELHTKDLINILDSIEKDIKGETKLSNEKRREHLSSLSTWLEQHAKSPLQTLLIRQSYDASKAIEILNSESFSSSIMLSFLMTQIRALVPKKLLVDLPIDEIPNIELINIVCEYYTMAITAYGLEDDYIPGLNRIAGNLTHVKSVINERFTQDAIYKSLFQQYEDLRRQVGLAIGKLRSHTDFETRAHKLTPLRKLLGNNIPSENLRMLLDELELRRLLLIQLCELTEDVNHYSSKAKALDSKNTILERTKQFYDEAAAKFFPSAKRGDVESFQYSILNGAKINAGDGWGQGIHYIAMRYPFKKHLWGDNRRGKASTQMLHYLFKKDCDVDCQTISQTDWPHTWGKHRYTSTMILNNAFFENAVLWLAQGNVINEDANFFLNGLTWSYEHQWNCVIQKYLVRYINNAKGFLNTDDLYKAYQFYHAIEAGEDVSSAGINQDCILWLVAILGNVDVIKRIDNFNVDVNKTVPIANFTPLMMAVYCGQEEVVDYLLQKGARLDMDFATRDPESKGAQHNYQLSVDKKPHLLYLATEVNPNIVIATKLIAAGLVPNEEQKAFMAEAKPALGVAPTQPRADALEVKAEAKPSLAIPPAKAPTTVTEVKTEAKCTSTTQEMITKSIQKLNDTIEFLTQKKAFDSQFLREEKHGEAPQPKDTSAPTVATTPVVASATSTGISSAVQSILADLISVHEQCVFFQDEISEYKKMEARKEALDKSIKQLAIYIASSNPCDSLNELKSILKQFVQADAVLRNVNNYNLSLPLNTFLMAELRPLIKKMEKYVSSTVSLSSETILPFYSEPSNQQLLFANNASVAEAKHTAAPAVATSKKGQRVKYHQ